MSVGPSTSGFVLCKTPNSGVRRGQQRALHRDGQRAQLTAMSSPPFVGVSNTRPAAPRSPFAVGREPWCRCWQPAARSAGSRIMYSSSVAARSRPGGRGGSGLAKLDSVPFASAWIGRRERSSIRTPYTLSIPPTASLQLALRVLDPFPPSSRESRARGLHLMSGSALTVCLRWQAGSSTQGPGHSRVPCSGRR